MGRFLFVVPPLRGHVNPTIAVGEELEKRGHEVAWAAHADLVGPLLPRAARIIPMGADVPHEVMDSLTTRSEGLRGAAALKFLWEDFLAPLARSMVPGVNAAVDTFQPSAVVVDQQAVAGALVARQRKLRWATSATTSAELTNALDGLPKVAQWVRDQLVAFQIEHGVSQTDASLGDLRFSDQLVIAYTTRELFGKEGDFPAHFALVGPAFTSKSRPEQTEFPFESLAADVPKVLVSLGTVTTGAGARFFSTVVEAFEDAAVQVVLVAPAELVPRSPANFIIRRFVPQTALLSHMNAVVCHAGHNTVCESLAHGLPLVVAPVRDDQPIVASQVANAGAGIRVRFGRVRPRELAAAVDEVLTDPGYRAAARRIQNSFLAAGGAVAAADRLEDLIAREDSEHPGSSGGVTTTPPAKA
ncbi:MAG: glycosyltransferase [Actinomycetota bacterium]|nr:glycosyltransferase [Actinomycetota bacterium]